jgi:hypothetical protein
MRKWWFNSSIAINGLLWLVGAALQMGGWVNQYVAIAILCVAGLWTVASVYWLRKRRGLRGMEEEKEELTIIKNAKVKLDAKNTDKATGMEVTTPTELNNINVNVTAENVKEATGFRSIQTNKPNALFAATIMCSCGKPFSYTSAGYKPSVIKCPNCGREHEIH